MKSPAPTSQDLVSLRNELRDQINLAKTVHAEARAHWIAQASASLARLKALESGWPDADVGDLEAAAGEISAATSDVESLRAFLAMRLAAQCEALSMPLQVLDLERSDAGWLWAGIAYKKPEAAAFAHFASQGWNGAACEGAAPLMLMKAGCLDFLASVNTFADRDDACLRYFEAQLTIHADKHARILQEIGKATDDLVLRNLREIIALDRARALYPVMDEGGLIAIWRALTAVGVQRLTAALMQDPYGLRAGWPDLVLARGSEVKFVEVKTSDKLHNSQRSVISRILKPLAYEVSALQLRRRR